MTPIAAPAPGTGASRLYRRPDRGVLGGVAAGIAEHTRLPLRVVRLAFIGLAAAGGLGVALYGAYLIVVPPAPHAGRGRLPRGVEYAIAGIAGVVAAALVVHSIPRGTLFVPALLACLGGALIWRQASEPERGRLRELSRSSLTALPGDTLGRVRLLAGLACVVAGAAVVLAQTDFRAFRDGLLAMVVTLVGVALVTGPWWMRATSQLSAERAERIRSQERADIAAQVHDSVLQTLALIQRNASSPREVTRLARGQERTLRGLLYGSRSASGTFAEALRSAAADIDEAYSLSVDVVVVGDAELDAAADPGLEVAVAAAREALANAAKHAEVDLVSLYAEVEDDEVSVFVKDRGTGFDPAAVPDDRQGLRGSIVGRVERHGGQVRVTSAPGVGTEVEIRLPRAAGPQRGTS